MKRSLSAVILSFCFFIGARAQVIILDESMTQSRMSEIKATVLDSLTREPVCFASVYLTPSKDSEITNFTLTDVKGEARLDEVPFGSYVFHVEMMGYRPFVKKMYFRERKSDMGTILLKTDEQFLEAAVVNDIGNPIVMKKDTVEFNASSFHVGSNAMLKDLLQRMPGMEITEDGKVKFNGEEINKLTVGGRTFFFNDQSTALNNLPASIVDKIRVIDRESEQTRTTGIQDGSREKVLDVALKKEYEKGWFGNVGVKGGTTLGKKDVDNPLRDNRGLLWSGNALVSAYTEKDQVTVIANGQNINDSNTVFIIMDEDGEQSSSNQGLSTAAQFAVNANTSRIKDVETTVGASYKYTDTDSGERTDRTTYQSGGNLSSSSENGSKTFANNISVNAEFEKEKGKLLFFIRPYFSYGKSDSYKNGTSETFREGIFVNSADNSSHSISKNKTAAINAYLTFREIGGKKNRSISVGANAGYGGNNGQSTESSVQTTASREYARTMRYDSDGSRYDTKGYIRYTEPLGDKWMISAVAELNWSLRNNVRNAFDDAGRNEYYSSESRSDYLDQEYDLTVQYKFTKNNLISIGGKAMGALNETFSKSYGVTETSGKNEWNWFFTPRLRFQHDKGPDRIYGSVYGYTMRPSNTKMMPVLDIIDPSRPNLGNIYLKPYATTSFYASWTRNDRERFSSLMAYLSGDLRYNPIRSAMWYDTDGILYSIPVNAVKPEFSSRLSLNYTTPLDARKIWSLTLEGSAGYSSSTSYQATTTLPGLDKDTFDYSEFMADFWGNADGDRFYGGMSGFAESNTHSFLPTARVSVKYNQKRYSLSAGVVTKGYIARYSLNPKANMNTLDTHLKARALYTTKHEFEFSTDLAYVFYKGYSAGYGKPEWQWNAEVSKNIGAFNLSIKVHDILNQTRNLTHTVNANYEEDSYRLTMGRYILFGVKWNFGKMNAVQNERAQRAAFNSAF